MLLRLLVQRQLDSPVFVWLEEAIDPIDLVHVPVVIWAAVLVPDDGPVFVVGRWIL